MVRVTETYIKEPNYSILTYGRALVVSRLIQITMGMLTPSQLSVRLVTHDLTGQTRVLLMTLRGECNRFILCCIERSREAFRSGLDNCFGGLGLAAVDWGIRWI
jgi:hypothetical protein